MNKVILVVVVLLIISLSSSSPVANANQCNCDPYSYGTNCPDCGQGLCCGESGYCGTGLNYCDICYCWHDNGYWYPCATCYCDSTCPLDEEYRQYINTTRVIAAAYIASPPDQDHDHNILVVATTSGGDDTDISHGGHSATTDSSWRQGHYGSAAICGPSSSSNTTTTCSTGTNIVSGQCLQVTNMENGKQAMVKIMNNNERRCINNINATNLVLDYDVFQQLDTSGGKRDARGYFANIMMTYKHVGCVGN